MSYRVQSGETARVYAYFVDSDGAALSGLSPTVRGFRESDAQWWTGSGYSASPVDHAASGITSASGIYAYEFNTVSGAVEQEHVWLFNANSGTALPVEPVSVTVGGFVDNIDAPISGVPAATWSDAVSGYEATSGSAGAMLGLLGNVVLGNTTIDRSDPTHWKELQYSRTDAGTVMLIYGLYGMDGSKISDTNNPFSDPSNRNASFARRLLLSGTI